MAMGAGRASLPSWFDEEWKKIGSGELERAIGEFLAA